MSAPVRFRSFLIAYAISPADAAKTLGCTRAYVSMLAHGKRIPSLLAASRIERMTDGAIAASDWTRPAKRRRAA